MENRKKGGEGSRFVNLCNENLTTPLILILISISICSMLFIKNGRKKKEERRKKKRKKK